MKSFKRYFTPTTLAITTLVIAACGGGSGGGGGTTPTNPVSLTTSNAKAVSAEILDSSDTIQGATAGPAILTGVSVGTTANDFNFPKFVVH